MRTAPKSNSKLKCFDCHGTIRTKRETYRYLECGLPDVFLIGIEVSRCLSCGKMAAHIPNIEGLHSTLARAIAEKRKSLTPGEIRFLRKSLGFSGVDFAKIIGKTAETVSRWESRTSPMEMSLPTEKLLRFMALNDKPVAEHGLDRAGTRAATTKKPLFRQRAGEWRARV